MGVAQVELAAGRAGKAFRRWRALGMGLAIAVLLAACNTSKSSSSSSASAGPDAPTGVTVTAGNAQISVSWTSLATVTSYNLYYSTVSGTGTGGTKLTGVTSPKAVAGLTNGTPYFVVVTAVTSGVESAASTEAGATPALPIPNAPSGVSASAGAAKAIIAWSATANATSYNLYYSTVSGTGTGGTLVSPVTSPYTLNGLTPATTYYFVVTAVDASGEGPPSTQVSATPAVPAPTGVGIVPGAGQAVLSWNAVAGATAYNAYYGTVVTETKASHQNQSLGVTSPATIVGLTAGTLYYFAVDAQSGGSYSAASATVSGTTIPNPPVPVAGTATTSSLAFSWPAVTGATSYNLYYSNVSGTGTGGTKVTGVTSPYTLSGLAGATTYYAVVTSVNAAGESLASAEASSATSLPAPTGVAVAGGSAQATITWTAVPGATGYNLYYGTAATETKASHVATQAGVTSPATIAGLTSGTTYYFSVTSTVGLTESAESTTVNAITLPSAVSGLAATPGALTAQLTWTNVTGAAQYNVFYSSTPGQGILGTLSACAASPCTLAGLTGGTTYYLVVTAANASGQSAASVQVPVTPTLQAPSGLAATPGGNSVRLSWTAIAGASGYNLYQGAAPGVTTATGTKIPLGAVTSYTDTTATLPLAGAPTPYYYVLTAVTAPTVTDSPAAAEVNATPAHQWLAVANGGAHTIAIRSDGTLWAWGLNANGQLGLGNTTNQLSPTQVSALTWTAVAAGFDFSLAIKSDGTLWAWGHNAFGQLGDNTTVERHVPTQEAGLVTTWSKLAAGQDFSLAIRTDGTLWGWGHNASGQLGDGTTTDRHTPTQEATLAPAWSAVAAGASHALGLQGNPGTLLGWGFNANGELGQGNFNTPVLSPTAIGAAATWTAIAAGGNHSLGVNAGALFSWGYNGLGQLGQGAAAGTFVNTPTQVGAVTTWTAVAASFNASVAEQTNAALVTLWTWGSNATGTLGLGDTADRYVPVQVGALTTWAALGGGSSASHASALQTDGSVPAGTSAWMWGSNASGQLGDGTTNNATSGRIVP